MTNRRSKIDADLALLDPTAAFASPEDVLVADELERDAKIEILRRWAYDALELEVAETEGMTDGEPNTLDRIVKALRSLGAEPDLEHRPPTRQGGV